MYRFLFSKLFFNYRQMYICDENVLANELDFKKALDLLNYLEDAEERDSQRLRIWARAILRDAWTRFDMDSVLQSISGTIFFKIIEFALGTGEMDEKISFLFLYYNHFFHACKIFSLCILTKLCFVYR